jgi:hypothetical protein
VSSQYGREPPAQASRHGDLIPSSRRGCWAQVVFPLEADVAQRCGLLMEETSAPHLAAVGGAALPWAMPPSPWAAPPAGALVNPLCLAPQENHPALMSGHFGAPQAVRGMPGLFVTYDQPVLPAAAAA